ncbi:MAG: UDP-phosphate galactose phosphotransferase [Alphaproteobacteria bacterium 41-28]|nr:MAG: UDP-phosphate galactose phosphotransferase [Alphaproteobacteria bacterium 41-28]
MKRIFDILIATIISVCFLPLILLISLAIKLTTKGPIIYWSDRVGKHNKIFKMPKFRTMKVDTPPLATRRMTQPEQYLTPIGPLLRKTSLDELPQLWSIIKGDMSFVGPRPILTIEEDLLALRTQEGIHLHKPGLTGWAQINGRDSVTIERRVALEKEYMERHSFFFDIYVFLKTIPKVLFKKDIVH